MIDIHSHLLPAIDDGSRSPEQSVRVLHHFRNAGVTAVILTPHVRASELVRDIDDPVERRQVAFEILSGHAPSSPQLALGFEIMLDQPLATDVVGDRRFSLAESRYYLVEFFLSAAAESIAKALAELLKCGVVPIVAHPERYDACSVEAAQMWRNMGAKIQVDATTLTRSSRRGRNARRLASAGLVDVLAADNHGDVRTIVSGYEFLEEHGAADAARVLTVENPRSILEDRELIDVPRVRIREAMWSRIKNMIR